MTGHLQDEAFLDRPTFDSTTSRRFCDRCDLSVGGMRQLPYWAGPVYDPGHVQPPQEVRHHREHAQTLLHHRHHNHFGPSMWRRPSASTRRNSRTGRDPGSVQALQQDAPRVPKRAG